MFPSHRNVFLPSGLLSTDVTTQPLRWTVPRGSSPWKREGLLSLQCTQCGPASPCCCRQHTGLVRHTSGESTGGWQKILFKMSTPHKLHEKMQASLELRSKGGKKWRVGDAQIATSHWRIACSCPWHSMSVLTGVSHGTPCVCRAKPQSQQLTQASFFFRVRSFYWGKSLFVSQQPELLDVEGLSRCLED